MQALIEFLRIKCAELGSAVENGDDEHVKILDREITPLLDVVFRQTPSLEENLFVRLKAACEVVCQRSFDAAYVNDRMSEIIAILDYAMMDGRPEAPRQPAVQKPDFSKQMEIHFLQAVIDQLQDQVLVVSEDRRVLFANREFLAANPSRAFGHIGLHITEVACDTIVQAVECMFADRQSPGLNDDRLHCHEGFALNPFAVAGGLVDAVLVKIAPQSNAVVLPFKSAAGY